MTNERTPGEPTNLREEIWNLPNVLTLGRILIIPAVVGFMLVDTPKAAIIACLLFSAAAITDFLDGYIARKRGLVSLWGQFLDPLADKLIVMATAVTLVRLEVTDAASVLYGDPKLPVWLVVLLLAREIGISGLRSMAKSEGMTIQVIQTGKWKTALQLVGIISLLIGYPYTIDYIVWKGTVDFVVIGYVLLIGSMVLSLLSAVKYIWAFLDAISEKRHYERPIRPRRRRRRLRGRIRVRRLFPHPFARLARRNAARNEEPTK